MSSDELSRWMAGRTFVMIAEGAASLNRSATRAVNGEPPLPNHVSSTISPTSPREASSNASQLEVADIGSVQALGGEEQVPNHVSSTQSPTSPQSQSTYANGLEPRQTQPAQPLGGEEQLPNHVLSTDSSTSAQSIPTVVSEYGLRRTQSAQPMHTDLAVDTRRTRSASPSLPRERRVVQSAPPTPRVRPIRELDPRRSVSAPPE